MTSVIVLSNGVIVTMQASIPWSNGTVLLSGETYPVMEGTMKLTLRISNVTWSDGGERICTRCVESTPFSSLSDVERVHVFLQIGMLLSECSRFQK